MLFPDLAIYPGTLFPGDTSSVAVGGLFPSGTLFPGGDLVPGETAPPVIPGLFPSGSLFPADTLFPTGSGAFRLIFRPPIVQRRMPVMPGLAALINYSPALLRINGQWVQTEFPSEGQVTAADYYFPGGYELTIDAATAAVLTAAGYSVDNYGA